MRKSSKARLFSTCLTGAVLAASAPAWAQTSDAPVWKPRAEVEAQAGKDIGVSTSLFAPVAQNDAGLVYVDGRIGYDQRFDRNGSATVGARFKTGEDTAIGVNVGADFYRSDIGSRDQAAISMGLEGFSSVFDVRVNYRLPLSKTRTIGFIDPAAAGTGALVLENNRLIERSSGFRLEAIPLQGFNGEAGVRLPVGDNASIRGSVGGFDYWDRKADESYRGVRGGLELDIEDRGSGARFTFGGVVEHDNRFGTDARAHVRLSIPFGGRSGDRGAVPTGLDRQMGDRVRRDYVARSGSRYTDLTTSRFAVDARTGNQFGGFYYASGAGVTGAAGTLAAPTTIADAVSRAGANGVVVALGNAGAISTPGVTLATNQYLVGGASAVDVRLINGSTVQYALGGTNGVVVGTNAAGAAVTLGQGSVIRDVTVRGTGAGIAANGVGGFAIERAIVENTGGAGIALTNTLGNVSLTGLTVRGGAGAGVLVNGGSNVSLANSTISGGAGAIDINDGGANLTTALSNLTLSATGGNVLDIDGSGAGTVTVTGLSGITIRGGNGETGGVSIRSATFDASTTTAGIQTVNAGRMEVGTTATRVNGQGVFLTDVVGSLSFADLDIANSGATGLRVVNSKANGFTLATLDGTIDTVGGTAADLDPLVINLNFASVASAGAAGPGVILNTVQGGGTGGNALTIGTLTVSNSGGDGLVILNSTGLVRVNGGAITNSGGNSVQIGEQGVAGSGGSVNLIFAGSITDPGGAAPIVAIFNAGGTINFTGPISGSGGILVQDTLAGSTISFGAITLTGTAGDAISLDRLAGSINFAGLVTIANPGANGIVIGTVPGGVTFGDVDITGLGNFNGVDVRNTHGTVLFNTLDITGNGTGAGTGINVTGSTNAGNVMTIVGGVIQGVNIGVDLSQADMTGQFRFGDGSATPMNSTISANVPIVIALMNASHGSYNFADANLVGDTSNLTGSGFTAYYAMVGATGAGTRSDPGSLAGADASTAQYIVLLNNPAGGQDVFDAASAGGSFDLAAGQSLVSFLTSDFFAVSGAAIPANLIVSGVGPAGIYNPYAGSGAAVLTTSTAGAATVNLANNSTIDGLVIRNAGGDVGVEGSGVSNVRIQNSNIAGATGAIAIEDGGVASSVQLTHLDLASTAGTTLALNGSGAGTLTVSGADIDIAATGSSAALSLVDVASGGLGFGTVSTGSSAGEAVSVQNVTGANLVLGSIAVGGSAAGAGVAISDSSVAVVVQSISVSGSAGDAVQLANNSGAITIGAISASGSGGDAVDLTGNGAVTIGSLSASATAGAGLRIQNSLGTVTIGGGAISGAGTGVSIDGVATGTGVSIGNLAINGVAGTGILLADVDGSVLFTGTTNISDVGTSGIAFGAGSAGSITFGDVNISGLGAGTTGVDARNASGTVSFNTLDITGSSTVGTRGIDLTGATFATSFGTVESGSISGVGIGVDLTNAAITGSFRDGDGSSTDADGAASTINAVVPIEITGLNGAVGTYNFADVRLVGDTSKLATSATTYYVAAGATGAGTLSDPGDLAGAEASGAQIIVLLNDPAGGQDLLDGATAGGAFDLAAGQWLLSFLNGDTLTLPGGGPANLVLYGITPGQVVNPFAGSGAPILTNSGAGAGLTLASNTLVDGVVVDASNGVGISAFEAANVTIRNSMIHGSAGAIRLSDGTANASAALTNLRLSSDGGAVLALAGSDVGTLTITAFDHIDIAGGNGEIFGVFGSGVIFDADPATAGTQTVSGTLTAGTTGARVGGTGVYLEDSEGALTLDLDVATDGGSGVYARGGLGGLRFATVGGTIDAANSSGGYGLYLQDVSAAIALDAILHTGNGTGVALQNVAGAGAGGLALEVGQLSVADGATRAIAVTGNSSGTVSFGAASTIGTTTGAAITLSNSSAGPSVFNYLGSVIYAGADALLRVDSGHNGTVNFATGALSASTGLGLVFQNADGTYTFGGATSLEAGISISGGSAGTFIFGPDTAIINPAGAAIDIQNSTASFAYAGSIAYSGGAGDAISIVDHSGGVIGFTGGPINITTGTGIRFVNADGNYVFGGTANVDAGAAGILITGGSGGTFLFGPATSVITSGGTALEVSNSTASVGYAGYLAAAGGNALRVADHGTGSIDLQSATLDLTAGAKLGFDNADGSYRFGSFATTGGSGIAVLNGSAGTFQFGDVDIAEIGAGQTAVNLTGATGNVTFDTLDITGIDPAGSKGIDLTGSTTAANIIINESSAITGVGIGVDLTNAAITGVFRYGDGSNTDADGAASLIDAVTPLVITGIGGTGTYDFKDVVLTGDTSTLNTSRTLFWVQAGATGVGTRSDPGSLAAAEASGADVIILLDTQGAGQDVIDGASAGGGLDLGTNQSLLSFLNGDTLNVGGGAPSNILLFGIGGGAVTNPYAGSGAPLLTTSQAGATTVNLATGALIDGVQIGNLDWKGVFGGGVTGVTIRNSVIQGGVNAIQIIDAGGTASVALSNLALSSNTGDVLSLLGSGGGQLAVTQLGGITIAGGNSGAGLYSEDVLFDADLVAAGVQDVVGTVDIGTAASRVGGAGLVLDGATGTLRLATTVFNANGNGILASGGAGFLTLAITGGTVDTGPAAVSGSALNLSDLFADIQLGGVSYGGGGSGVVATDVTGVGTGTRALDIGVLTVASGAARGIALAGTTNGNFTFGSGSSIAGTTVAGVELANTGAGVFNYAGSVTGITTGALVSVSNGDIGTAAFGGTLSATGGTGLQFSNADGTYNFIGNVTLNGGDAGIDIVNGSSGAFLFETGTAITSPSGAGIDIQNSTAAVHYRGSITFATAAQAAVNIVNHSGGTILLVGALNVSNGTGLQFSNADGSYDFTGPVTLNGGDAGIDIVNGSGGTFSFGSGVSITSPGGAGIDIQNSTATVTYLGNLTYATAGQAAVNILNHNGGAILLGGALNVSNGTGLQFSNADGSYDFTGPATLNGGDAGIDIVNGSGGTFSFGSGVSITSPGGAGIDIQNSTATVTYLGNLTYATAGQPAINVVNHSAGTIRFQGGTLTATNGSGVRFNNADGTYEFTGPMSLSGGLEGIQITNGSAGTFNFGAGTTVTVTLSGLSLTNSAANVTYSGTLTASMPAAGAAVRAAADQSTVNLASATLNVTNGMGISFNDADGTYTFGSFALSGGATIAVASGSSGTFAFGDVDITGLGANQTAVNLTGATGNVTFDTLDITGTSTTGSKGIDLTGNNGAGNIVVTNSSTITGVGIGVDLTNVSRTGLFRYGDGESAIDVASTISATTPLVITGLNGATGTYNFADVNLVGDTSGLATTATVYYVLAGASGTGTLGDPGSLAGAEAATADIIVLLNNPAGGQDVLDALGSNGNDSLVLDANQALRSFRDGNTISLPGGAPANVILTGVMTGQVVNPYAASALAPTDRAPILTTTGAAAALVLANNVLVDGVFVQGGSGQAAVQGSGLSGVTLANSTFSGAGIALRLTDGAAAASATLNNLTLSANGANTALALSGAGAGSLTLTGSGNSVSHSGSGALMTINDVLIGAGNLGFTSATSTATGGGVDLGIIGGFGTLSFGSITVTGATGTGVSLHNSTAPVNLGNVTVSGAAGTGLALTSNSGAVTVGTVGISSSATGVSVSGMANTLTVGDTTIDGATVAGIVVGAGNTSAISFGNVDITALQTGARGVDARTVTGGNIAFATLDIAGASATGTRGIDLTNNSGTGAFIVNESSTITGVDIGVDLTGASRISTFRYGDGSNVDFDLAASTINATTPIVIAGLNGASGTYDFRDVNLVGDTSPLQVSAFFVRAGATGVGSRLDPGSLAAADASTASYIVLLDTQAGAGSFDTLTGTLTLADGQSLLSFRDVDSFNVAGGAPPNVFVFNVTTGTISNPNAGSGAPLLTSADATGTVRLGGNNIIDGVVVANSGTGAGIYGSGAAGSFVFRNSTISGGGAGINLLSGAATLNVNLQNLTLRNGGGSAGALLNVNGTGGTLTVVGLSNLTLDASGGETAGLVFNTATFDSNLATAGIQAVNAGAFTIGTAGARVQGDGLSLTNVSGALTFSDIDIANDGGTGLLVANSKVNSFLLTTLDGSVDTINGTAVNLDPLTVNMTLASVGASGGAYGIQLDQVEGFFTVTGAVNVTNATTAAIAIENNTGQVDPLDATFNGAVTINNTTGAGLSLTNNGGATIAFAGGGSGVDVTTTSGAALNAAGGGTISFAGSGNSLTSGTGTAMSLNGVTVGAAGVNFAGVGANGGATGVVLTSVTATGGGTINLGTVNLQGITSRGIDVNTALGAALSIADLDIGLNSITAVAFDLNGAALSTGISANDFDVTNAAAAGTSVAVDLRGTTGAQTIRLGDAAAGGAASSIAGVGTGVWLNAATNAGLVFGDGEAATDGTSSISAVTQIDASAAPTLGTYNFVDVTFGASPGLGFGVGRTWFVDSNGATGGGNGSGADGANPMTLAAAELALAATDVIILVNNGNTISAAGSNGNDTLTLLANAQVRGFGQGALTLTLTVPSTILLSSNTINIADPTGNGAATLTSAAGANIITLGASGNRISGFILDGSPAGALRGIVDAGGATGTVVDFMTIRNFNQVGSYGVEITPSTNTTIDNVGFTGNTNDVLLNAAGSTISNVTAANATGTSITLDNATGTTTLTNVNISGAATGLSFTNAGGTINATNVDIANAGASALTVSGGTAGFNFDAASSITQTVAGLVVNFTGNHTAGTFAFAGTINATDGAGMQFSNADGTYNFTGTTTLNGGNAGIDIYNGATGSFGFGAGTTLTHNGAGNAFVLLSSANVTFDGTITDNDGLAVEIDGHDAGTATFNGAISSSIANASTVISIANSNGGAIDFNGQMNLATTGVAVVSLSNNNGSTTTFNAGGTGLDLTNTTGAGMLITGGGTVNVQGSGNSIATTSGTLLSITNTGATATTVDLAFASASNTGGANGIFVQRTAGTLGGTVNIGGGAITASTRGVSLDGDALAFTYGGTVATSGGASRSVEATNRTGGVATLSGNLTDTSQGISATNNTGGTLAFTGQTISLTTGANTAVTLTNNAGATISFAPAGGSGFDIVTTSGTGFSATGGGTVIVTGAGNSIQTATGQVLNLTGVSAGAGGINFGSLQSTGNVAGIAINFNNFDSTGGGAFSGGTTSIAATTAGDAIFIGNGSAAAIGFGATTIGTTAGTIGGDGIEVNGSGNGAVTFTSVDIDGTTAHGVNVTGAAGATGAIAINGGSIGATASSAGDGVNVTGGSGNVTVAATIAKNNAGNIVEVSSHTGGTVTFSGNLSATGATANGILLNNNSGGAITFSGATKTINTGANNAIQFDNTAGTGAAVSFTGGNLDIDTTSGRGITATSTTAGAGSLTIQGSNNTITSVGGIALNLVNTNIAAGGLNFLSVSANGGARGIVLNNTGATAGLTITGTGTTVGSGGTIQNITARGIELLNTAQVSIANLNLTNASTTGQAAGQDLDLTTANGAIYMSGVNTAVFENIDITGTIADNGITGINVSNFQLNNSLITGAGDGANESGIEFNNLSGTSSLTNTEIALSETNSLDIVNTDVSLNLTLDNVTFRDTQSSAIGEGGLQFRSFSNNAGSPTTNIDIINSDFLRLRTQGIQVIGEDDSIVSVDIVTNTIDSQAGIGAGIDINGNDTATVNFNVNSNTIQSQGGAAVNITSFLDANVMGRINGNTITVNGSGAGGSGVRVVAQETSQTIVSIANNNITAGAANNSSMIDLQARFSTARLDATVSGNTINSDAAAVADINITSGSSTAGESNQVYVDLLNNIIVAGGPTNRLRLRVSDLSNTNRLFLTGFVEGGAGIEDDAVATWNARGNTPTITAAEVNVSLTGSAVAPLAGTALTPTNPLP